MVRLKDIAQNLGLSVMAVSKALRDASDIAPATKERVRREAARLGYVPNQAARMLREGSSRLAGVIVPALNEPVSANVLWGIEQEASDRGYQILAASSRLHPGRELDLLVQMCERRVEAIFILPMVRLQHRSPLLEAAHRYKVPLMFIDQYPADAAQFPGAGWVVPDAALAGRLAAEHLLDLGHQHVLYLSGPAASSSAADHYTAFKKTYARAGSALQEELVFLAGFDIEGGKQATMRALAEERQFSAVAAISDAVALGAAEILAKQGYRMPKDVSLVGYGDGLLAANFSVPITTVRRPQVDLGRQALALWAQSRENGDTVLPRKIMPVDLVIRDSTLPVRAARAKDKAEA